MHTILYILFLPIGHASMPTIPSQHIRSDQIVPAAGSWPGVQVCGMPWYTVIKYPYIHTFIQAEEGAPELLHEPGETKRHLEKGC